MNTPTTSDLSERAKTTLQTPAEQTPGENALGRHAWFQDCEMGMAYCRMTEQLSSEPGSKVEKELRCLECTLEQDLSKVCCQTGVKLIDLGTGDGQKMLVVIKALNEAGIRKVRYIPVDTNPYISRYAIFTILGSGKKSWKKQEVEQILNPLGTLDFGEARDTLSISTETLVRLSRSHPARSELLVRNEVSIPMSGVEIDFFQDLPKVVSAAKQLDRNGMNIFCMLGNTFGNYAAEKRTVFLATLYDEMEAGDLLLLGVCLRPREGPRCSDEVRRLQREYLPGEVFMHLDADHPQATFRPKYDPDSCCMIHSFERPDKSTQDMGYSYLFDAKEVVNNLETARFEVISCESYPSLINSKTPGQIEYEPRCLTLLARKSQSEARRP